MNPLVSVIIPCYNYEGYLDMCIESLANEGYDNKEIIVVHDGCGYERKEYDGVTSYWKANGGVSTARNYGFDKSRGEYIWFLDADDMALGKAIKHRLNRFEKKPYLGMVFGNARKINVERGNYVWSYKMCATLTNTLERYSRRLNAQTLLWKREVFEKYGLYYENLTSKEDKELLFRLGLHPQSPMKKVISYDKVEDDIAIYRRHPEAKHKRRLADKKWSDKTDKIFNKLIKQLVKEGITKENTRFPS